MTFPLIDKIQTIRNQLQDEAKALFNMSSSLQEAEIEELSDEMKRDIKNIERSSLALIEILSHRLSDQEIKKISGDMKSSDLISAVRHDLRNSINAISGYAEIVLEDLKDRKAGPLQSNLSAIISLGKEITFIIETLQVPPSPTTQTEVKEELAPSKELEKSLADAFLKFKEAFSILIVDDSKDNCHILESYLRHDGYQKIDCAFNGIQALDRINNGQYDLVLLDIGMPGMSGLEVLTSLQDLLHQQKLMVLMISGSDTFDKVIQCIKLGAEEYLVKPFNRDLLRVRIGTCLEKTWFINQQIIYQKQIEIEKHRYEKLLQAVFPPTIVKELTETGKVKAQTYKNIAVLFIDVVGFTSYCDREQPDKLVRELQELAVLCETISVKYHLQKIKTIGDAFMAVAGMHTARENPVLDCINCACEIIDKSSTLSAKWQLHAGVDFGSVIGGIIGHRQYLFDVWGDTVNTAARLQKFAQPNRICLSAVAHNALKGSILCHSLGMVALKGKESMEIFEAETSSSTSL